MERSINLDVEQYETFLKCLGNLKDICNDVDIQGGIIRQRTTDKSTAFEIDLSSLIEDVNLGLSDIKNKLDMLKVFNGQEVQILIDEGTEENPGFFIFSDQYSSLKIKSPTRDYLDNKFMNTDQMGHIYSLSDEDLLIECDISKMISDRVKIISQGLNATAIQIIFSGETASMSASTQARDQHAKFLQDIITNVSFENSFANLSLIPFSIEHDTEIIFKMYINDERNISINTFKTTLGDININMYSRSSIISEEE